MWCWNRCITETTPGWTSAELSLLLKMRICAVPIGPNLGTDVAPAAVLSHMHIVERHLVFLLLATGEFSSSPTLPLPTMLFLFLFGSSDKHLLCESDKPYPKPHRGLKPKATNRR